MLCATICKGHLCGCKIMMSSANLGLHLFGLVVAFLGEKLLVEKECAIMLLCVL